MSVVRLPGARFRVTVDEPIVLEKTGHRDQDVEAGVRAINAYIERHVRARPGEWFWVHKRWPQEAYAELAQADAAAP
jgi:KDO2-lipid IV(A) lauroyltransferase